MSGIVFVTQRTYRSASHKYFNVVYNISKYQKSMHAKNATKCELIFNLTGLQVMKSWIANTYSKNNYFFSSQSNVNTTNNINLHKKIKEHKQLTENEQLPY